jgi:hypothetical protein
LAGLHVSQNKFPHRRQWCLRRSGSAKVKGDPDSAASVASSDAVLVYSAAHERHSEGT